MKFTSHLLKSAATNAVIKEAQNRYKNSENFPKDQAGINQLFDQLDTLVPKEVQSTGLGKQIYLFLLRLLFKDNPPGFILGEDDYKIKPLMKNFVDALQKNTLGAADRSLDRYRSVEELEDTLAAGAKKKDPKLQEGKTSLYTPEEEATIQVGAEKVYEGGGWVVWKCPRSNDQKVFAAAKLLCDNPRHGVKWCVGRSSASSYIPDGDFFVLEYNGVSRYAISSIQGSQFTIWNPKDTPVFTADARGGSEKDEGSRSVARNLQDVATKNKIPFDLNVFSSIPQDVIPVLKAIYKSQPALSFLPPSALEENRELTENIYKVLSLIPPNWFVSDLNSMYSNWGHTAEVAQSLLNAAASRRVHMVFDQEAVNAMNSYTLNGYLQALALKGELTLPKDLDDMLIKLMNQWIGRA